MNIRRHLLVVTLLIVGVMIGAALSFARADRGENQGRSDRFKEGTERPGDGQKWEYCVVSKNGYAATNRSGLYWITYFRSSGLKVVDVEDNATSNAALAKAIARLGDEGWEMVGLGPLEVRERKLDALYFKRPKQEP